jgi:dimethylargininase
MFIAITRAVSDSLGACELTHLDRSPIDVALARHQHREYEEALRRAGCDVVSLPPLHDHPDAVFVEDVAIVLDEVAIITRPGASSRRGETASAAEALAPYRTLARIDEPGTLDGGDVLRMGHRIYVGLSGRSNAAALARLRAIVAPYGYTVEGVPVTGCLHLKSAVTELAPGTILVNPAWVDPAVFGDVNVIPVDPGEPYAANGLPVRPTPDSTVCEDTTRVTWRPASLDCARDKSAGRLIYPASFPRTRRLLESRGIPLSIVEVSELQKAEGAVTCCSLVFRQDSRPLAYGAPDL